MTDCKQQVQEEQRENIFSRTYYRDHTKHRAAALQPKPGPKTWTFLFMSTFAEVWKLSIKKFKKPQKMTKILKVQSWVFGRWCLDSLQILSFSKNITNKFLREGILAWTLCLCQCVEQIVFHVSVCVRFKKMLADAEGKSSSGPNYQLCKPQNFTDDPDLGVLPWGMIWIFIYLFYLIYF